jgi:hypothetical protein
MPVKLARSQLLEPLPKTTVTVQPKKKETLNQISELLRRNRGSVDLFSFPAPLSLQTIN